MHRQSNAAAIRALILAALGLFASHVRASDIDHLYANPQVPPATALRVFHLGHSLVGRDMPAMVAQLAGAGHDYESQLGWGTTLKAHWEPGSSIEGFDTSNDHPNFRPAREAVDSGVYDAIVLTEMVEIKDAVRYFDSPTYLRLWAEAGWRANADTRVYLYETWHRLDDPAGWLERIDGDLAHYWEARILVPALRDRPIHIIPAGQVLARFTRAVEARGGVGNVADRNDLFSDAIHLNDLGAYLVALTHYAVLYHRNPLGAPHRLQLADGSDAIAPHEATAELMQQIVWDVVSTFPKAGVAPHGL